MNDRLTFAPADPHPRTTSLNPTKYRLSGGPAFGYVATFTVEVIAIGVAFFTNDALLGLGGKLAIYTPSPSHSRGGVFVFDRIRDTAVYGRHLGMHPSMFADTSLPLRWNAHTLSWDSNPGRLVMAESVKRLSHARELVTVGEYLCCVGFTTCTSYVTGLRCVDRQRTRPHGLDSWEGHQCKRF